jgi:hypothetical protein
MFDSEKFTHEIYNQGYSIVKDVLPKSFTQDLKLELSKAIDIEVKYHGTKNYSDYGMVLLCSLYGKIFCDLFDFDLARKPFDLILGKGCIVYAYTSSSMPPNSSNYSGRIHVDCPRIIPGYITNLGATILLDDFNEKNGATWFLPHSQERWDKPTPEEFYSKGLRLIEKAGSIWFFNARIWHAGGKNLTNSWRHALTINMVRPWMKQRIDIPRAMSHIDVNYMSHFAKQKLGFYAQIPASYSEYYVAPQQRKFKQEVE